ncbi:MAG: hypothetical protein A6F70_08080 [Cycloclasticus sp. symbiont of Bathymodiolus heckerae]|nr:MAG: hypothetical protein A6F70_08080 [Cycloclasticus sp. symbiont of Bathymodiolus heckerae]
MTKKDVTEQDAWHDLKCFTFARIALGRAGGSLRTNDWLDFKLAHAKARDAVHEAFNSEALLDDLRCDGQEGLVLESQIKDKANYLRWPDLGRCLDASSKDKLKKYAQTVDLVIVVSDGLSARAVHMHSRKLLAILMPKLEQAGWSIAPIVIVRFARVAVEDEIGSVIGAKLALMLIGERPGLGSADSLGAYLVCDPKVGNTDADRNCVSNIRPVGLTYEAAAETLFYLLSMAKMRNVSGVILKDDRIQTKAALELK